MSDIRANTISDAAGTGPIDLYKQSAAKAHVNFDGATIIIEAGSLNVASVTDSAVGKYVPNFTTSFSSVPSSTGGMTVANYPGVMRVNPATGSCQIFTATSYSGAAYVDSSATSIQCCGDLA